MVKEEYRLVNQPKLRRWNVAKFKFTQQDLDDMVVKALGAEPTKAEDKTTKPNVLEILKSKTGLNRIRNERL